jgi:hypothetical protein
VYVAWEEQERLARWETMLRLVRDMLDTWLAVQRQWLYLEPIFHTRDIQQQLPLETKRFKTVHRMWRNTMTMVHTNPNLLQVRLTFPCVGRGLMNESCARVALLVPYGDPLSATLA